MPSAAPISSPPPAPLSRGRRITVAALVVLGTVLTVAAILALFVNRQALDAENWSETSSELLEDPTIRKQVAAFLVDETYASVDVSGELEAALPPRLKPLAGPAAGGLRTLAERTAERALGRPRVQELWRQANRVTAQQFIDIADGNSRNITIEGNAVILNLRVVVTDLIQRLGLPNGLASKIPQSAGAITIMRADEVETAQNGVKTLRGLAVILPALALGLLALAVALAPGHRRRTLLRAGIGLIVAGALVLLVRLLAGEQVVSALATTAAVEPAAENAWQIGTQMLRDVAQATIILGLPLIAAAWLAGMSRPAIALRRLAAPTLRERPGVAYSVALALIVLLVVWGPLPATRSVIPVLAMTALLMVGVAALRRQVSVEFPATSAGGDALRARAMQAWQTITANRRPPAPAAPAASTPPAEAAPATGVVPAEDSISRLERLSVLHDNGALTDDEFVAGKALLLATNGSAT